MRRRLVPLLCILVALAFASLAAGGGGAKFKVRIVGLSAQCNQSCPYDVGSIVIRRLDDDRRPCRPFVEYCTWTGRAGTKLVLETTADPPLNHHEWFLDCTGTGNCTMIMDSNKFIQLTWTAP